MSKQSSFTPGPWSVSEVDAAIHQLNVYGHLGVWITDAQPCNKHKAPTAEMRANARLIAAAPELLEACKAALKFSGGDDDRFNQSSDESELCDKLRAAIAKAEGHQ